MGTAALTERPAKSPGLASRRSGSPCARCDEIHTGCSGHARKTGKPCGAACISGGTCCSKHGGMATQVREAAAQRYQFAMVEGEIAELMREADIPQQHPLDGLLEVVRHTGSMMRMLSSMVAALEREGVISCHIDDLGKPHYSMQSQSLVGVDHEGDGAAHVLVLLYEKWTNLHMRACKTALDANIDERLVRNAEATSESFFRAFGNAVDAAGLTSAQRLRLVNALADELRKLNPIEAAMVSGKA